MRQGTWVQYLISEQVVSDSSYSRLSRRLMTSRPMLSSQGVGVIKLMGRDAGFVAAHAALASNLVDLVLVPEVR